MKTKVQVKDLRIGDQLSRCKIAGPPIPLPSHLGKKNQVTVVLDYGDGKLTNAVWSKYTTVTVINR